MKIEPAITPGSASGIVMLRSVRQPRAPRSPDASRYEWGIRSSDAYTGSHMNGSQTYENTIHIAQFVYARLADGRPIPCSAQLRTPPPERIVCQA